ncbi:Pkinase-domain-containing protein [Wallemia mellicola]|nr:Pkinase-domain-containing protein [Wallemia mellicola]
MKSPPRPKSTKLSETCPPPPETIHDKKRGKSYERHGLLGEGGFARVYEVEDERGYRLAIKTISKSALQSKKNRTKLYAEIKLHKALSHPNIVGFEECFEDDENVYMLMELCKSGNMMDLLRSRKRYTAPETRFFLVQLIGACQYMHEHSVIHRDLKLGNLFLDEFMNVKVGDFGLAALIEREGERKNKNTDCPRTICGTPNYIAPEVLFDTSNGHSFEVDVWSIGVIM